MATRQYAMTPDVFSSPAIDLLRNDNNGNTPVASFQSTVEKNRKTTVSRIPIAPKERTERNGGGTTNLPSSPSPWELAVDDVDMDVSFTQYINPLAEMDEDVSPGVQGMVGNQKKVAFEMQTPEAVQILHKISTRMPLSNVNENVLDCYLRTGPKKLSPEPSMQYDILVPRVQQRGKLFAQEKENARIESSEDENVVSDGEEKGNVYGAQVMEIASPVLERGLHGSPEEVPPTCCPDQANGQEHRRHDVSPVSFNLDTSPESLRQEAEKKSEEDSFSFGMGGGHQVTAKLVNVSGGESVDQPNPFASMIGRLRDEPACIQSPVVVAVVNSPLDNGESPKSPSHCTPMNLISASGGSQQSDTPNLGTGNLDAWIKHRKLESSITTPTRRDLQKMWDAVRNIRETTEAYEEVVRANAELCEELAEVQEAEAEARLRAEEEGEIARNEILKSREISEQMMELSASMYQEFSRCEEERRSLTAKLEEARQMIRDSSQDGMENITKELEKLKVELDTIRKAEAIARIEAEEAKSSMHEYEAKLKEATEAIASMDLDNDTTDGVKSKVEYFEALCEHNVPTSLAVEDSMPMFRSQSGAQVEDDAECPTTGHRAPQPTPVDTNYTTTPYRIFNESMQAFRESMDHSTSEDEEDSGSDYEVEEISVSPIAADGLTKSTLRETVRDRLLRLRTELEDAKSKLNHVELGLQSKQRQPNPQQLEHVVDDPVPAKDCEETIMDKPENTLTVEERVDDTYLPKNLNDSDDEDIEEEEFQIPANTLATPASYRSRFARRFESLNTPLSLKRPIFTPNVGVSATKSTGHYSPHCASSGSCTSPAVFVHSFSRPRARRFGPSARPKSESAEREFRRRAAAMKIHLSPYFKRSRPVGQNYGRQEIDTVL